LQVPVFLSPKVTYLIRLLAVVGGNLIADLAGMAWDCRQVDWLERIGPKLDAYADVKHWSKAFRSMLRACCSFPN
jgi:hypothetical protein